jgi:hypothetical protein
MCEVSPLYPGNLPLLIMTNCLERSSSFPLSLDLRSTWSTARDFLLTITDTIAMQGRKPEVKRWTRSRTGCLACKKRKVKCDEGRPTCRQCTRLVLKCDYKTGLEFKDLTRRIQKQMAQDIDTGGSCVWDCQYSRLR